MAMKFSISFLRRSAVIPLWILKVVFNLELKLSIPAFVLGIVRSLNLSNVHSHGAWRFMDR